LDRASYLIAEAATRAEDTQLFVLPHQIDDFAAGIADAVDAPWTKKAFYEFLWRIPDCNYPFVAVGVRPHIGESWQAEHFRFNPCSDVVLLGVRGAHNGYAGEEVYDTAVFRLMENLKWTGIGKPVRVKDVIKGMINGGTSEELDMHLIPKMRSGVSGYNLPPLSAFFAARVLAG